MRNPTLGHAPMMPARRPGHQFEIICSECQKSWLVSERFPPSPTFQHRQLVAAIKGVANVVRLRRRKAA
jgi:hypothetical protein